MSRFEVYNKDGDMFWDHEDEPNSRKFLYEIRRVHGDDPGLSRTEQLTAEAVFALNLVAELDRLLGTHLLNGLQSPLHTIPTVAKTLVEGFQDKARRWLLERLIQQKVAIPAIWHRPQRTEADDPAHGCECCDGEDYCTCPGKELRAKCLGCGGRWPDCDPLYRR